MDGLYWDKYYNDKEVSFKQFTVSKWKYPEIFRFLKHWILFFSPLGIENVIKIAKKRWKKLLKDQDIVKTEIN